MKNHIRLTRAFRSAPETALSQKEREIHDSISCRAHELFVSGGFTHGHDLRDWFAAEAELYRATPLTVSQTEKDITVKAELPGLTEHDIEVSIEPRRLSISGQRHQQAKEETKGPIVVSEHSLHAFCILDLPAEVDPDKVRATFNNGELVVTLIKKHINHIHMVQEMVA